MLDLFWGRLWGNQVGPVTFQKTFILQKLPRLLSEFSRARVQVQGLG